MGLSKITGRDVHINACSATTGDGLREGLEWCIKKFEARGAAGGGAAAAAATGGGGAGK
jgi:hypothetical protein